MTGDDRTLSDLGIVGGDLLLVHATDGNASSASASSSAERIADRVSNVSVSGCNSAVVASSSTVSCRETSTTQLTSSVAKTSSSVEMITDDNVQAVSKVLDATVNRYLRQPMLLRDSINGSLPESLAITYANVTPHTAHEAVAVVLHVLMTESDFAPLQVRSNLLKF